MGFIMVPCHYSLWRAMLDRAQLLRWISHFLIGAYGFPLYLMKKFFRLSRNSRENRTSFRGRPNISNGLARRESEF
jgi:hypothetical protein